MGQNLKNDAHGHAKIIVGTSPTSFGRAFRRLPGNTLARCDFCVFERVRGSSIGHRRLGERVSAEHTRYRIQQKETLKKQNYLFCNSTRSGELRLIDKKPSARFSPPRPPLQLPRLSRFRPPLHSLLRLSMDEIRLWIVRFYITSLRTPLTRNRGGGAVVFTTGSSP